MILDIAVLILFILALFKGWRNGLVLAVFSFLAYVIGVAAALKFSSLVALWLGDHTSIAERWLPVLAFLLVFILTAILVRLGARAIEGVLDLAQLGWLNRLCGVVFYCLVYLFSISVILFYARQLKILGPETLQASVAYSYIEPLGPWIINSLAVILPFFRNMFEQLREFFNRV